MRKAIVIVVALALIAIVAYALFRSHWIDSERLAGTEDDGLAEGSPFVAAQRDGQAKTAKTSEIEVRVKELCSTCHVLPTPDVEPKNLWAGKVREMYEYAQGPRPVPPELLPPIEDVIDYWTFRAPEYLPLPVGAMGSPPSSLVFERHMITLDAIPDPPSISNVRFITLADGEPAQLLICDMRHGLIALWDPSKPGGTSTVIGHVPHPTHTQVVDLDGDGLRDILVANLGDYWPVDTTEGSVVWLRNRGEEAFETIALAEGMGRVNDVQAADFDEDGDLDLVVADFGNLTTGRIVYFENLTEDYDEPEFEVLPVEEGAGTSDVPVLDLNGDGHLDFVALQSQEKERVLAFLNRGWGSFRREVVYQAPHPRWGSTGIRLIDLDGDDDMDLLFNHGDSVQIPPIPRPYHGFGWLENRGTFPFAYHRLAHLPGAHTTLPADLDKDGDLDLVSSVFIPVFDPNWPNAGLLDTVIWLEQTSPGEYERHSLETSNPYHPCGDLGDYDGDGDIDIVLGNFCMFPADGDSWKACITLLENQLAK